MAVIPGCANCGGGSGGGGGVVQQGSRSDTAQGWYVDNAPGDTLLVEDDFQRDLRDMREQPLTLFSTTVTSGTATTLITPTPGFAIEIWKFGWTPRRTSTDTGNICALQWNEGDVIWSATAAQITHVLRGDTDQALDFDPDNAEEVTVNIWYREV